MILDYKGSFFDIDCPDTDQNGPRILIERPYDDEL